MTINELIDMLEVAKQQVGGDTEVCVWFEGETSSICGVDIKTHLELGEEASCSVELTL